jgi:YkoY family integral membrane protein
MLADFFSQETLDLVLEALPVIISLIIIEGLLSVDNALAIAAMASHLPGKQKYWALRVGIIGAYVFRGLALLLAQYIIENPWLKLLGAAYLIHLMAHHFATRYKVAAAEAAAAEAEAKGEAVAAVGSVVQRGFWGTVASIELMDLSLGVDNVVAAVALSDQFWVVCTGVFIGILALRFVAGHCIKLIEKFPVLEHTAFLLIGFVGLILVFELTFHHDIHTTEKFIGIVTIIAFTIWYSKSAALRKAMAPVNAVLMAPVRLYDMTLGAVIWVLLAPFRLFFKKAHLPEPVEEVEHALEILHDAEEKEAKTTEESR